MQTPQYYHSVTNLPDVCLLYLTLFRATLTQYPWLQYTVLDTKRLMTDKQNQAFLQDNLVTFWVKLRENDYH